MWAPQPGPQVEAIRSTWCENLLFGGARGGGKSQFLLGDFLKDTQKYKASWRGLLLRRTFPQIQQLLKDSLQIFPEMGGVWKAGAKEWQFPGGASLWLRQAENLIEASGFQGFGFSWIGMDEGTLWDEPMEIWHMLKACLRNGKDPVPTKRMRMTANPGGPGHDAVKAYFIDHAPLGYVPRLDISTGERVMFIPSRVTDNKILLMNDPNYIQRLKGVGSPELVKRWLDGDWSTIVGSYFKQFSKNRHIIEGFNIPKSWVKICGHDWGTASPGSVIWAAISDGNEKAIFADGYKRTIPAGAMVIYREWYIAGSDGKGLKLTVEEVAKGILAREPKDEEITYRVADTSIFDEDGGPSIAETFKKHGVVFRKSDKRREPGWQQIASRLNGDGSKPMIFFFNSCPAICRYLPSLQHDPHNLEDVDTNGPDHAPDALRYLCMSRPYINTDDSKLPIIGVEGLSLDELWKREKSRKRGRG